MKNNVGANVVPRNTNWVENLLYKVHAKDLAGNLHSRGMVNQLERAAIQEAGLGARRARSLAGLVAGPIAGAVGDMVWKGWPYENK